MILNLKPFEVDLVEDALDAAIYECERILKEAPEHDLIKSRKDALWAIVDKLPVVERTMICTPVRHVDGD